MTYLSMDTPTDSPNQPTATEQTFRRLLKTLQDLSTQGSTNFDKDRANIIGASELGPLLDIGLYSKPRDIIMRKITKEASFEPKPLMMLHGNFFEETTFSFIKRVIKIDINKVGGPYTSADYEAMGSSLDGLGLITEGELSRIDQVSGVTFTRINDIMQHVATKHPEIIKSGAGRQPQPPPLPQLPQQSLPLQPQPSAIANYLNTIIPRAGSSLKAYSMQIISQQDADDHHKATTVNMTNTVQLCQPAISIAPSPSAQKVMSYEIKNAFKRTPQLGVISDEYMTQVQAGMNIISGIDACLFVDCVYKICSVSDCFTNKYANNLYYTDELSYQEVKPSLVSTIAAREQAQQPPLNSPIMPHFYFGYNLIVSTVSTDDEPAVFLGDLSQLSEARVRQIINYTHKGIYAVADVGIYPAHHRSPTVMNPEMATDPFIIEQYTQHFQGILDDVVAKHKGNVIGYVPWKLYTTNVMLIPKYDGFITDWVKFKCAVAIGVIRRLRERPELDAYIHNIDYSKAISDAWPLVDKKHYEHHAAIELIMSNIASYIRKPSARTKNIAPMPQRVSMNEIIGLLEAIDLDSYNDGH
jgi:hypothetical protein